MTPFAIFAMGEVAGLVTALGIIIVTLWIRDRMH